MSSLCTSMLPKYFLNFVTLLVVIPDPFCDKNWEANFFQAFSHHGSAKCFPCELHTNSFLQRALTNASKSGISFQHLLFNAREPKQQAHYFSFDMRKLWKERQRDFKLCAGNDWRTSHRRSEPVNGLPYFFSEQISRLNTNRCPSKRTTE